MPTAEELRRSLPGLAVAIAVAAVSRLAASALPSTVSEVLVAILLGIVVANVAPLPPAVAPGIRFAVQRVLRLGIVLLGARLSLDAVLAVGAGALGLVLATMTVAFAVALLVGRAVGVPRRLALLIGVGSAVCGNSAIVATAPVIKAEERETSFAVATITLFGTLAVFVLPVVGLALGLPGTVFGVWAGVAVNDTSQVVAAGAAYSPEARDVATVVKLVRNALMAPLIVLIAWWWRRNEGAAGSADRGIRGAVPLFVLGFLALAALRTVGAIGPDAARAIDEAARALILVALAGVGLNTRVAQLRSIGLTPFAVGVAASSVLAAVSLLAILALGIGPSPRP
ncbi:MAG TPA: putative sulfate exporter family transporter [Candidatus Limnocylindria bacterium]|nr:putative sulfate exporter family transporter [Candidatus Limnocylindria bacterium]